MTFQKQCELDNDVHEYLTSNQPRFTKGAPIAVALAAFLNGGNEEQIQNFLTYISEREHRTLQQIYFNLVLSSIKTFAGLQDFQVDDRNKASVEKAKKLYDFIQKEGISLRSPLI